MSWRTSRFIIGLRNAGRYLGLNRLLERLLSSKGYEHRFKNVMLSSIRPGDCVWDIGANIGIYSNMFSDIVGSEGQVFAFEPSQINFGALHESIQGRSNVTILPVALGDREGLVSFHQGEDAIGATSRIATGPHDEPSTQAQVALVRGDKLLDDGIALAPNFIKIDTEGFELEVLKGLTHILENVKLRAICVEVHFSLLNERGMADVPSKIESLLESFGFRCAWPDASHIAATRVQQ